MAHTHVPQRRNFLKLSARLAALGLTGLGLGPSRKFFTADVSAAAHVSDYKALVCLYLFGGNDSNNMIVPVDTARYAAYQSTRGGLALTGSKLLSPIPDAAGSPYALHYGLAELNQLYSTGHLAFVLNVGQLNRPLTRDQYLQGVSAPSNLFSHSDQTTQAQTGTSLPSASGWGGRLLDLFGATDTLAAVSVSSPALFLQGVDVRGNVIPPGANLSLSGMSFWPPQAADARRQAVNAMVLLDGGNPVREAANQSFADGLQLADTLQSNGSLPPLSVSFPGTSIGNQLKEVARLMRVRSQMGPGRQVFFCSMGGFDTHSSQDWTHWNLLQQLSQGLAAFATATQELGLAQQVTAFTQSEFNRTMQSNGSGSDHAWGSHQLVLGGAVRGGIYGQMPTFAFAGPSDANNRGVWIPTISSAQFGATLGRWFGASPGELGWAFPNLTQFPTANVGFML
ncbi:MAG: DUF1501 domain-containing protein [Acidobacteria bacterium]|nr:DUF1501 domain-containing protein [Acidobacteriota bacterium]